MNKLKTLIFISKDCASELESWAKKNLAIVGGVAAGVLIIEVEKYFYLLPVFTLA